MSILYNCGHRPSGVERMSPFGLHPFHATRPDFWPLFWFWPRASSWQAARKIVPVCTTLPGAKRPKIIIRIEFLFIEGDIALIQIQKWFFLKNIHNIFILQNKSDVLFQSMNDYFLSQKLKETEKLNGVRNSFQFGS